MNTIHKASNYAHEAVDKVASAATHATEAFDEKSERLKKTEKRLIKDYTNYTRDNPITSLGIALAAGFLISRVLSGR
jgi:ElaB/YqjD/DUF883 family membrane-anchored ribosome-binding protein